MKLLSKAIKEIIASKAPLAPKRCPVIDFVEEIFA